MQTEDSIIVERWLTAANDKAFPRQPTVDVDIANRLMAAAFVLEEALEMVHAMGFNVNVHGYNATLNLTKVTHSELQELLTPHTDGPDLAKVLDAESDLRVVAKQALLYHGLRRDEEAFYRVMEANRSKFWTAQEVAGLESCYSVRELPQTWFGERRFVVKHHNKIQKPPSFVPPAMEDLVV